MKMQKNFPWYFWIQIIPLFLLFFLGLVYKHPYECFGLQCNVGAFGIGWAL